MKQWWNGRKLVRYALLLLGWTGLISTGQAQGNNIRFEKLSVKQGLAHKDIHCILQDKQGYLWFGTKEGLNQYDGYTVRTFTTRDGLSSNFIQALHQAPNGDLWIGTLEGGLNRYNSTTGQFTAFKHNPGDPSSISSNHIATLFTDKSGTLWIGTLQGGLCKYLAQTNRFKTYRHSDVHSTSLSGNSVYAMLEDEQGFLWLGTNRGLGRFNPKTEVTYTYQHDDSKPLSLPGDEVVSLYTDRSGTMWVGTQKDGLCRFNRRSGTFTTYRHNPKKEYSLSDNEIVAIQEDALGTFWVATGQGGLNQFDPKNEQFITYVANPADFNSLSSNHLTALCLDHSGSLWIGTQGGGVNTFQPNSLVFHSVVSNPMQTNGFLADGVTALLEENNHMIWIGTSDDGLYRYDRQSQHFTSFRRKQSKVPPLCSVHITALCKDNEGLIWMGTTQGLCRFDPQTGQLASFLFDSSAPYSLSTESISTLYKDGRGHIWVGTDDSGLFEYNPDTRNFSVYRHQDRDPRSISSNAIATLFEDRAGLLWIGTQDAGLSQFNPHTEAFTNFRSIAGNKSSLISNTITAIAQDYEGYLWVGTPDDGLCRFNPQTHAFTHFQLNANGPEYKICSLLRDKKGMFWISTTKGLIRFNPRNRTLKNYTIEDGLYSDIFIPAAGYKSLNGELFFGGDNHFLSFRPDQIIDQDRVPPVYLTSFQIFNSPQTFDKPLSQIPVLNLEQKHSLFSLEFVCLSFLDPESNQYAYKLEGFDKDWNPIGNRRNATFTNIDPGTYTFRVRAADKNGIWNEQGASIRIVVHPAWYNTLWFQVLAIALIAGASYAYYRRRIYLIERQRALLEELVRVRTAELILRTEEIAAHRDRIEATNMVLNAAKKTIEEQNEELKTINNQLEYRVEERTQELQHAYSRLLESNQELDTFIYRASHDIRGPVARLMGLCKVALLDVHDPKAVDYFHLLEKTGEDTNETLVRILRIYDIRNLSVHPQLINLSSFIESILTDIQTEGLYPPVSVDIAPIPDMTFTTDENLLRLILRHVLDNAHRYQLHQRKAYCHIRVSPTEQSGVCIQVIDNGRGIPEEVRSKLFTMFFKGTERDSGAGLGLYVSKLAAQKMGGTIRFTESEQHETVFEIQLPSLTVASNEVLEEVPR